MTRSLSALKGGLGEARRSRKKIDFLDTKSHHMIYKQRRVVLIGSGASHLRVRQSSGLG
jgi:hypothetical protein